MAFDVGALVSHSTGQREERLCFFDIQYFVRVVNKPSKANTESVRKTMNERTKLLVGWQRCANQVAAQCQRRGAAVDDSTRRFATGVDRWGATMLSN